MLSTRYWLPRDSTACAGGGEAGQTVQRGETQGWISVHRWASKVAFLQTPAHGQPPCLSLRSGLPLQPHHHPART